ncbi:MAG: hypothetical protein JW871_05585 [Endomicrobiales bacterium]|nr:hypothetical protein [Endomicrobiales bacterium]
MKAFLFLLLMPLLCTAVNAQSLFEDAQGGGDFAKRRIWDVTGFGRTNLFLPTETTDKIQSSAAETSFKFTLKPLDKLSILTDLRFRNAWEFEKNISEVRAREYYALFIKGRFDLYLGRQIIAWGRADAINPTDNITPKDMTVRSVDEDDKRIGNELLRVFYNFHPYRIELIWVPFYREANLPTHIVPLPQGVSIQGGEYPDKIMSNGACAIRFHIVRASFDCSVSYFDGYNPMPGISLASSVPMVLAPKAYRVRVAGADFSTTAGSYGLRGEFAYKKPYGDYDLEPSIPNPEFQYVLGVDREYGDFSIIVQYTARYVNEFSEINILSPAYFVEEKNRQLSSQQDRSTHAVFARPSYKFLYETLVAELALMYNMTTQEYMLRPKAEYSFSDTLSFSLGAELYKGPDDTLFGLVDDILSAVFISVERPFSF